MKKINLLLLAIMLQFSEMLFAQDAYFLASTLTETQLNSEQTTILTKLKNQNIYKNFHFITTQSLTKCTRQGWLTIDLPFLPAHPLSLKADQVEYSDDQNFIWNGNYFSANDTLNVYTGSLNLLSDRGIIIGHLQLDEYSFEIYDLTGGLIVFCETDMSLFNERECASQTYSTNVFLKTSGTDPCEQIKTKVLVLYTPASANNEPNITGKANLAISQINSIWSKSQINNTLSVVAIKPISFYETGNPVDDVNILSLNSTAQALRNQYKAEIVVLLTSPSYGDINGIVKAIGGASNDAYCLVSIATATNGRYTFAHEVNHLFGAHHDNDPDPGNAHGHIFKTGDFLPAIFGKNRYTLMAVMPKDKSRLENVSNPNVSYYNKPTGTSGRNNAEKVNNMVYHVASFYMEQPLPLIAKMSLTSPASCDVFGYATATSNCGQAPYTYEWYMSDNGINWYLYGNTQSITTVTPIPPNNGISNTRFFNVKITDANNNIAWSGIKTSYYWCKGNLHVGGEDGGQNKKVSSLSFENNKMVAYPNPNNGLITLELALIQDDIINIGLYDLNGILLEILYNGKIDKGFQSVCFSLKNKPLIGVYLLSISGQFINQQQKLVIQ
jgi:hypothetical protein